MIEVRNLKRGEMDVLIGLMKKIVPNIEYYPRKNLKIFMRSYSKKHLLEIFGRKESVFLLALDSGKPVGFLFGWNEYGVFWIDWLGVEKHKRRRHIATAMIETVEKKAKCMRCHKIFLDTSCTNFPALNLYKKLGYSVEATLRRHWLKWNYDLIGKFLK